MSIFNFKKFNESISKGSLTEEHRVILQDIIEDIWSIETENQRSDRPFRQSFPDIIRGNIALRTSVTFNPGNIASIIDYKLSPGSLVNKSDVYGFSIRINERSKEWLKRALDLFTRQTGIKLETHTNDERQTIIAEPHVIRFINNVLNFENSLEEIPYMLPAKYSEEVEIRVESWELEMQIEFPVKNRSSLIMGCYLDMKLSRGVIIGGDLPLSDSVKYNLEIGSLRNFEEKRDDQSIWQFAKIHKGEEYQFEFDITDTEGSCEEIIKYIDDNILSKIELPRTKFRSEIESQLSSLKRWAIKSEFEYMKIDVIEVELTWKGNQYQFYLYLDKLGDTYLEGLISIKQGEKWIDKSSVEDLSETIYLALVDGKLKITE